MNITGPSGSDATPASVVLASRNHIRGETNAEDVIRTPPGVQHWYGASPTTAMTHIAFQEAQDGKIVEWMEKVSDKQYGK